MNVHMDSIDGSYLYDYLAPKIFKSVNRIKLNSALSNNIMTKIVITIRKTNTLNFCSLQLRIFNNLLPRIEWWQHVQSIGLKNEGLWIILESTCRTYKILPISTFAIKRSILLTIDPGTIIFGCCMASGLFVISA